MLLVFFPKGLCHENLTPNIDGPQTLSGDLQGFWDMMMLQVDNVDAAFSDIDKCRENGWKVSNFNGFFKFEKLNLSQKIQN